MNNDTDHRPSSGSSPEAPDLRRAWDLLGRATPAPVPHGFAARVAALAARTPQEARPSRWLAAARLGLPLAAAAALLLSVATNLLLPDTVAPQETVAVPSTTENGDLTRLARLEAALLLLPDDAEDPILDDAALELASVDDPATLTDEQLFGLVY
jgi:hypothetical protein